MTLQPDYYYDKENNRFEEQPIIVVNAGHAVAFFVVGCVVSSIVYTLIFLLAA